MFGMVEVVIAVFVAVFGCGDVLVAAAVSCAVCFDVRGIVVLLSRLL